MTGYILEAYNNMGDVYTSPRMIEEAKNRDITLDLIGVRDTLCVERTLYNAGRKLQQRDFVINRYKWGKMLKELNRLGTLSYNELSAFEIYVNKFEQRKRLSSDAFRKPKYLLGHTSTPYEQLVPHLGSSIVAKGLENSMGREIFLIEKPQDMAQLTAYGSREWLFEEFIAESYGRDLRVYSVRGQAIAAMIRRSQNDFRANVALGARTIPYDIDEKLCRIATDIYAQTGLDFVGIDLLFGEDALYLCEINVMPGLMGIERATGVNVAGAVMETIRGDLCSE